LEKAKGFLPYFGNQRRGPNINNTSKAALADHVAQYSNALCHIDEYKNNLDFEKIESLRGL
jgi:DNA primase